MPGIGKTSLLSWIAQEYNGMMISFNGDGNVQRFYNLFLEHTKDPLNAFGQVLLTRCGISSDLVQFFKFEEAIAYCRTMLQLADDKPLVICVDEIGVLEDGAVKLMHYLMNAMDDTSQRGKLIFVFSHVLPSFLLLEASPKTGTGRPVILLDLKLIDLKVMLDSFCDPTFPRHNAEVVKACQLYPAVHQLFLSCSGHPPGCVRGLPCSIQEISYCHTR